MAAHPLYSALGVAILVYVAVDVLWTTMHRGGGPTTRLMVGPLWSLAMRTRHRGLASHRLMSIAGLTLVVLTVLVWIALLWGGWTLVFMGDVDAVVRSKTEVPADVSERIYFVGFTVFTLGIGDFMPTGAVWQVLTTVASLSGFMLVTFVVTYLMPVVQSAVSKRAFASRLSALGDTPEALIVNSWDGNSLGRFETMLENSLSDMAELRQAHSAYPVLHFFHEPRAEESIAVTIARMDEAVRLAELASAEPLCATGLCRQWRGLTQRFVETMGVEDGDGLDAPPLPSLEPLAKAGVSVVSDEALRERFEERADTRRRARDLVLRHGWTWSAVRGDSDG